MDNQLIQLMKNTKPCHYDDEWFIAYDIEQDWGRVHIHTAKGRYNHTYSMMALHRFGMDLSPYSTCFSAIKMCKKRKL